MARVLSDELADWLCERCGGDGYPVDPADALPALCAVTAELIKLSAEPARTRAKYLQFLDRFLAAPNALLLAIEPEPDPAAREH